LSEKGTDRRIQRSVGFQIGWLGFVPCSGLRTPLTFQCEWGNCMADADTKRQAGPAEFAVLVRIYNSILAEPWFTMNEAKRDRFRRYIIEAMRAGVIDAAELTEQCREMARHHFSEPVGATPDL
jgi:hypothetical protein